MFQNTRDEVNRRCRVRRKNAASVCDPDLLRSPPQFASEHRLDSKGVPKE